LQRMEAKGRDLVSGIPRIVEVDYAEVNKAVMELLETIVQKVKTALEHIPPELAGDIVDTGIVFAGGGALLKNFDRLLPEETGLSVRIAVDPLHSVVLGSGKALDSIDILRQVMTWPPPQNDSLA
jgi:rod shape-determining protein MreB